MSSGNNDCNEYTVQRQNNPFDSIAITRLNDTDDKGLGMADNLELCMTSI